MEHEKGYRVLRDEDGEFLCNVMDYQERVYNIFGNDFCDRLDGFKKHFPVYDDDIYLLTYPKSGTHWLWEILMMLTRGSAEHRKENKEESMLEIFTDTREGSEKGTERPKDGKQRILNTHLCVEDVPPAVRNNKRAKFIQLHRNPADVAVSYYHHARREIKGAALPDNWDNYITKLYFQDRNMPNSTWFDYTTHWWPCNSQDNFLSLYYEDLKENPVEQISKIAEFIGVKENAQLVQDIAESTAFDKMKVVKEVVEKESYEKFFAEDFSMYRKGTIGDWRNHFSRDQHVRLIEIYERKLKDFPELRQKYDKYLLSYN